MLGNKIAFYCAVVFAEFMKRLAAISLEHAVALSQDFIGYNIFIDFNEY